MNNYLFQIEDWLKSQYKNVLGMEIGFDPIITHWFSEDSLTEKSEKEKAFGLALEDSEIGWIFFISRYSPDNFGQQINQALGVRSCLMRESNYTGLEDPDASEDKYGSWRVGLIWLVPEADWTNWQQQILEIRRESGASEEINFDAIRYSEEKFMEAVNFYGFPRLLINTRSLLQKSEAETEKWLSADDRVKSSIKDISQKTNSARSRAVARQLEEVVDLFDAEGSQTINSKRRDFTSLGIKNFRNIESLEISIDEKSQLESNAIILFGPNGTGKSSFSEALSLAAFGTSPRLENYLNDSDIYRPSAGKYIDEFIVPKFTDSHSQEPSFLINGLEEELFSAVIESKNSEKEYEGVILNQEDSIKFTEHSKGELATKVLKGYSELADVVISWLEVEFNKVDRVKKEFCRSNQLNASITKSETAYNRLALKLFSNELNKPSSEFLDWLRFIGGLSEDIAQKAEKLLFDWGGYQSQSANRLAETLSKLYGFGDSFDQLQTPILETLENFNKLSLESENICELIRPQIKDLEEKLENSVSQINLWGDWLISNGNRENDQIEDLKEYEKELDSLSKERTEIEKSGRNLRERLDVLDQTKKILESHWSDEHPDTCPICDSNVSTRGGISKIVVELTSETTRKIQEKRENFALVQKRQNELESKIKASGSAVNPISIEDQNELRNLIRPFIAEELEFEEWLINKDSRIKLIADLTRMKSMPNSPKIYTNTDIESERLVGIFKEMAAEADRALEDPQAVQDVKRIVEKQLENILVQYLPSTLEKVWIELTLSLTTASWLLPSLPSMTISQRGKSLSLEGEDDGKLVRYIYNAAEKHALGLAWFFTNYFAKKRFKESWLLLDDPAQEMDQPSFRELIRLWETLLRLQTVKGNPLTLIVALHQEDRALNAARATNGKLYVLGWKKKQDDKNLHSSVKKVVLLAPGFHPQKPDTLFNQ